MNILKITPTVISKALRKPVLRRKLLTTIMHQINELTKTIGTAHGDTKFKQLNTRSKLEILKTHLQHNPDTELTAKRISW